MTTLRAIVVTVTLAALAVLIPLNLSRAPVQAAADSKLTDACVAVAQAGAIVYYYCEPEIGPRFVANSVGFVVIYD